MATKNENFVATLERFIRRVAPFSHPVKKLNGKSMSYSWKAALKN